MKKIKRLVLTLLRNGEYFQFMSDFDKLMLEATLETLEITAQYQPFKDGLNNVDSTLKVELGSSQTKIINEKDDVRDKLDRGFNLQVDSYNYHWDEDVVEAARRIDRIVDQYGNLRNLSFNEESSGLDNKYQMLTSAEYAPDLVKLDLSEWANKVIDANNVFKTVFSSRANEESARASGNVRMARTALNPAYEEIVIRINALVVVNGEEAYAAFIDKVNYYIDYYTATIAARKRRNNNDDADDQATE